MPTIQSTQKRIERLQHECGELEAQLAAAGAELDERSAALPALQAAAVRNGSKGAAAAAQRAEAELVEVKARRDRFTAALAQAGVELAAAELEAQRLEREAVEARDGEILAEMAGIAAQVDEALAGLASMVDELERLRLSLSKEQRKRITAPAKALQWRLDGEQHSAYLKSQGGFYASMAAGLGLIVEGQTGK